MNNKNKKCNVCGSTTGIISLCCFEKELDKLYYSGKKTKSDFDNLK